MNLLERAEKYKIGIATLKLWLGEGAKTVDKELAQKRADVCLKCPLNKRDWAITESIANAVKEQVEIKNKLDLHVIGERELHTCAGCGCCNSLKIWIPIRNILPEPEERANFHENCWLLKES